MAKNLKQPMEAFNRLYSKTQKTVTFKPSWNAGFHSVGGAVNHIDFRIILEHGEVVKCQDNNGRRILLIGTVYGLIAINETFLKSNDPVQPLHYTTTQALASIWESYHHEHLPTSDYMHAPGVPDFTSIQFLEQVADLAAQEIECGRIPGDGLPRFISAKPRERRAPPAKANPKQEHQRRHQDDKKAQHFKQTKKKVQEPSVKASPVKAAPPNPPRKKKERPARVQQNVEAIKAAKEAITEIIPRELKAIYENLKAESAERAASA